MIGHIVFWKLKPEACGSTAAENAVAMKSMLDALPKHISEIRDFHVSVQMVHTTTDADVVLFSTFASLEDLERYQNHPEHQRCVDFVRQVVASRHVIDYSF